MQGDRLDKKWLGLESTSSCRSHSRKIGQQHVKTGRSYGAAGVCRVRTQNTSTGGQGSVRNTSKGNGKESKEKKATGLLVHDSSEKKVGDGFKCHMEDLGQKWAVSMDISNKKGIYDFY